jgi:potassium channel subfamily K
MYTNFVVRSQARERIQSFTDTFQDFAHSKRAVLIGVVNILIYHCLAVIAFSFLFEHWPIIDSLYFAVVTFTTVGYGDMSPHTDMGRLFVIFFAIYGILILGFFISVVGEIVIDAQDAAVASARKKASKKVLRMFSSDSVSESLKNKPKEKSLFRELLEVLIKEIPILVAISLVAILIGAVEGWSIIKSLYFCVITSTTIGFGDLTPTTPYLKVLSIIFIPISVAVFGEVLGRIAGVYFKRNNRETEKEFMERQLTLTDLTAMDSDGDGKVCLGEFLGFMLVAMGKCDRDDIEELRTLFHSLDATNDGFLEKDDLVLLARRRREKVAACTAANFLV